MVLGEFCSYAPCANPTQGRHDGGAAWRDDGVGQGGLGGGRDSDSGRLKFERGRIECGGIVCSQKESYHQSAHLRIL